MFSPETSGGATTPAPTVKRSTEKYIVTGGPGNESSRNDIASITSPGSNPRSAAVALIVGGGAADGGICTSDGIKMSPDVAGMMPRDMEADRDRSFVRMRWKR